MNPPYSSKMHSSSRMPNEETLIQITRSRNCSSLGVQLLYAVGCACSKGASWELISQSSLSVEIPYLTNSTDNPKTTENLRRRARVNKRMCRRLILETAANFKDQHKQTQPKPFAHGDFAPEEGYENIRTGQVLGRFCRFCLVSDHQMNQCKFTPAQFATIKETNFQI